MNTLTYKQQEATMSIQWVDKNLNAHEDFLGFINIPDISAEAIVKAIKDVLVKL